MIATRKRIAPATRCESLGIGIPIYLLFPIHVGTSLEARWMAADAARFGGGR